ISADERPAPLSRRELDDAVRAIDKLRRLLRRRFEQTRGRGGHQHAAEIVDRVWIEYRGADRPVKRDQAGPLMNRVEQRGDIAVSDDHLWLPGDQIEVQIGQNTRRPPAARIAD